MAIGALGSVSVASDGTVTKSGMAGRAYDALADYNGEFETIVLTGAYKSFTTKLLVDVRQSRADLANMLATWMHDELTNRADVSVTVSTSDAGLQRTPDPNDPNTATLAPSADKTLSGGIS